MIRPQGPFKFCIMVFEVRGEASLQSCCGDHDELLPGLSEISSMDARYGMKFSNHVKPFLRRTTSLAL